LEPHSNPIIGFSVGVAVQEVCIVFVDRLHRITQATRSDVGFSATLQVLRGPNISDDMRIHGDAREFVRGTLDGFVERSRRMGLPDSLAQ
jgi:hypothetical protein